MRVKWVILALLVLAVAFWIGVRFGRTRPVDQVSFTPVDDLPAATRDRIDQALAQGKRTLAVKVYRDATGASLAAGNAAVDVHARGGRR